MATTLTRLGDSLKTNNAGVVFARNPALGPAVALLIATVVFVGGSLIDQGGHNILEPAVHGKPIVFGPHMSNFTEIVETFLRNQAAVQVSSPAELSGAIARLIGDPVERARLGAAARALVAHSDLTATEIVRKALEIAADICVYSNRNIVVEELTAT